MRKGFMEMWRHVWPCARVLRKRYRSSQMKPSDTKWIQWSQVSLSEAKWIQVRPSETKWNQVSPRETKWNYVKPKETKWVLVKASEPK